MTVEVVDGVEVDFSDLESKYSVQIDSTLDSVIIIDHLPKIDRSKEEKLLAVLRKNVFSVAQATPVPDSICMPRDVETEMSKGYMFIEFESAEQATAVLQIANGYRLDKSHVLSAVRLSDFDRLLQLDEDYKEPMIEKFEEKEYLKSWLSDTMARDQFVTLAGTTASIFWNARGGQQPELVHTRPNWTDSYVQWSPRGSYLATVHGPGVMLWGGASFSRLGKFPHQGVRLVGFSSTETFMVTWSPFDLNRPTEFNLFVWDILAGKLVRGFSVLNDNNPGKSNTTSTSTSSVATTTLPSWPMIKFSFDDKYAARAYDGALHIYELPSFTLLDKKPHPVEGLKDLSWSPVDQTLVHWTVGTEDIPARVSLISIPSRRVMRTKNLFNVNSCQIYWQSQGYYMCVQVERHSKNRKQIFSNLELFRLREKDIPVDCLEFKEPLLSTFVWEPEGHRFVVSGTHEFKTTITFYTMRGEESSGLPAVKPITQIERKSQSRILWSPQGDYLLFFGVDSSSCVLEFFSALDMTSLATREHFLASEAAWDPSGRFVASWVSAWKQSGDHGFILWDMRGEQIARLNTPRMSYFAWRPRPPMQITRDQQREIRQNLKKYSSVFEDADLLELSQETSNSAELKSRLMTLWNEWRRHCRREYETRTSERKTLIGREEEFAIDEQRTAIMEEWIEEVIEESEELIGG